MSRQTIIYIVAALVIFGLGAAVGVFGYINTVGGSGEPSQTLVAPTLPPASSNQNADALATQVVQQNATIAALRSGQAPEATAEAAASPATFSIDPTQSEARFNIMEDLFGAPNKVVGRTNQIVGLIQIDPANPANSHIGGIRIDARTLVTDQEMRNRAIRAAILQSAQDQYEFIDFTPTAITGMPASVKIGDALTFKITGDLKIRDIVQSVTFDVTLTVVSNSELKGSATAQVTRTQYHLDIPRAPGVANVADEVTLEFDFVAIMQQ